MTTGNSMPPAPCKPKTIEPWRLTASQAGDKIKAGELTVEEYARSLLRRINQRDASVEAWAYLDEKRVIQEARALDRVPFDERGPLHGIPIAIKDVIYTRDMPTQHNSSLYKNSFPSIDASSVSILRNAGALIFGKTTTTEFAAIHIGPKTRNPHNPEHTPGGSSSGSGAAVGDYQIPIALGTQTGGSTIRPGSFNGVYAFKPTWGAISREGQKLYSITFDTLGLFARSAHDLDLLADVFDLRDDESSTFGGIDGARFALCRSPVWDSAGPGTRAAMDRAAKLLKAHGADVVELDLGPEFDQMETWHHVTLFSEGHAAFLPEYRNGRDKIHKLLVDHVENRYGFTRKEQVEAFDGMAALRPKMDEIARGFDAIITPSVPDEAPAGLESTGDHIFCSMWSALHNPVINVPGFKGENNLPIGLSLVAPRFHDRHLLRVAKSMGKVFEAEGGWNREMNGQ